MDMSYDDPDEMARQQMAENLARIAESSQTPQEPEAPDVATINRLASEKYTIRPELADYISRMREGVNDRAIEEKYRNQTWDTFDKLGDIRANTYGLKNVHIGSPDTTAQTEAANVNKLTQAAELGDITRHSKLRDDLALALARKRGGEGKIFLRESGGFLTKDGKPVATYTDPNTGEFRYMDSNKRPIPEEDIISKSTYNQKNAQTIADQAKTRDNAFKIGEELSEFSRENTSFDHIDDLIRKQSENKLNGLDEAVVNEGNPISGPGLESPTGKIIDLPGVTLPIVGRIDPLRKGQHSALQAGIKRLLGAYQKTLSGLTASNEEAKRIRDSLEQGKYSSEGEMLRGLKDLKAMLMSYKEAKLNQYGVEARNKYLESQGLQPIITPEQANAVPTPVQELKPKKLYSKSRNQTKIIYPDGREEIVDGKQD